MMTELMKEALALPALSGGLAIASVNGSTNTGTVDMRLFNRVMWLIAIGSGGTGNAYLKQTNNSNGATASNMQSSPQNAAALGANGMVTLECRSDQMTARYSLCQIVTDAAYNVFATALVGINRYEPASAYDNASVNTRLVCNV